jgi:Fe2+ transport system protein B
MKKALPPILFFLTIACLTTFLFVFRHTETPVLVRIDNTDDKAFNSVSATKKPSSESVDQRIGELNKRLQASEETKRFLSIQLQEAELAGSTPKKEVRDKDKPNIMEVKNKITDSQKALESNDQYLKGQIKALEDLNTHLENEEHEKKEGAKKYEAYMPMVVTGFLGLIALGMLFFRYSDPHAQKWIFGTLGSILGYWLKGGA